MDLKLLISAIKNLIDSALLYINDKITKATEAITRSQGKIGEEVSMGLRAGAESQGRVMANAIAKLETAISKIKEPKFTGEVTFDTTGLEQAIEDIKDSIKQPDLKTIENNLTLIYRCIEDKLREQSEAIKEGMMGMAEAVKSMSLNVPSTFKIDDMQMRALKPRESLSLGGGGTKSATQVTVANVTIAVANTEYSYTFPANVVNFVLKTRAQNATLQYAWATGTLPTSGTGALYMTAPANFIRGQNDLEISGKTIYFQATLATTAEIETYRM